MSEDKIKGLKEKYPWLFLSSKLTVDIIYDLPDDDESDSHEQAAVDDTIKTAKSIAKALQSLGHTTRLSPITPDTYKRKLSTLSGDIIFNQVEHGEFGFKVLKLLEKLHKPVTGIGSAGFELSWDKDRIKKALLKASVPTPLYFTTSLNQTPKVPSNMSYPLFVKAADDHGSLSITSKSFVKNHQELIDQVKWIGENIGGDALVEEYIDGRELDTTILGNDNQSITLPPQETTFNEKFSGRAKIITYEAKWEKKSLDYQGSSLVVCPTKLSPTQQKAIEEAVKKAARALGARDYARFDIRLKGDIPYIIDYNANPGIGPKDPSSAPAKVLGLSYPHLISSILSIALSRYS